MIPLIDALTAELDNKKVSRLRTALALVGGLYMFLMYFAPMITAGILLVGSTQDGDSATLLAWAGAFAVGQIVFRIWQWIRAARGGEPAGAQEALMVAVNVVFGLLTTWTAYTYATFEAPPGAWLYFVLFLVMTLACLASVIMMRVRGRAHDRGELVFNQSTSSALAAEIARLPEAVSLDRASEDHGRLSRVLGRRLVGVVDLHRIVTAAPQTVVAASRISARTWATVLPVRAMRTLCTFSCDDGASAAKAGTAKAATVAARAKAAKVFMACSRLLFVFCLLIELVENAFRSFRLNCGLSSQ